MEDLIYSGYAYIRPIGRGICLLEQPGQTYLEDLPDGDVYIEIKVTYPKNEEDLKKFSKEHYHYNEVNRQRWIESQL